MYPPVRRSDLWNEVVTDQAFIQVSHIPKVADIDTSITCTNIHGQTKVIPIPKGTELTIATNALHYNRKDVFFYFYF